MIFMAANRNKHGSSIRPAIGNYGRIELAFTGAPCVDIQQFTQKLSSAITLDLAVAYVDASHDQNDPDAYLDAGITSVITKHESRVTQINKEGFNRLNPKIDLLEFDLTLLNGNHFEGKHQVVFLDSRKTDSLMRNRGKLTDVLCFVDVDANGKIPTFLGKEYEDLPVFNSNQLDAIVAHLEKWIIPQRPKLNGLVLAGGKSLRMGEDKGSLKYHQKPQREHVADLLKGFCDEVFISIAQDQQIKSSYPTYADLFIDMGPLGAILTAFRNQPDSAWLVIACDIPMADASSIEDLIKQRSKSSMATAYQKSINDLPEPLFAIWEPKIYGRSLQQLSMGIQCPRKLLINSPIHTVIPSDSSILVNANSQDERNEVLRIIQNV